MFENRHLKSDVWHQTPDIRRLRTDTWHQTSDNRNLQQMFDIRHLKSDFRHEISDIRQQTDIKHLTSDNKHQRFDIYLTSNIGQQTLIVQDNSWCLMSNVWFLMSDVWCLIFDVRCLMSDVRCLMSDFQCPMFEVWCPMSHVWFSISDCRCLKFNAWLRNSESDVGFQSSLPSCIELRLIFQSFQYQRKGKWSILQWSRPNDNWRELAAKCSKPVKARSAQHMIYMEKTKISQSRKSRS